jgi:hypothetical protein
MTLLHALLTSSTCSSTGALGGAGGSVVTLSITVLALLQPTSFLHLTLQWYINIIATVVQMISIKLPEEAAMCARSALKEHSSPWLLQ